MLPGDSIKRFFRGIEGRAISMLAVEFSNGVYASLVAAGVSTLGLVSIAVFGDWGRRNAPLFSAFAVGVLTVAVLFHLVPEAIRQDRAAWQSMAAGFIFMAALGVVLRCCIKKNTRTDGNAFAFGFASIVALGFHSFIDGVVYESTFYGDDYTGMIATFGLLLHEFPEGVIAFHLMRKAGLNVISAVATAFITSSATTVLGALAAGFILTEQNLVELGQLLGLAIGALVYIIAFHLGPHGALAPRPAGYIMGSIGVVIAILAEIIHHLGRGH